MIALIAVFVCTGCTTTTKEITPREIEVACFDLSDFEFGAVEVDATPFTFMQTLSSNTVVAAINGVYYGADDGRSQGNVWVNEKEYASGKGRVSGYLLIGDDDTVTSVESLDAIRLASSTDVIGTHPLLISQSKIHEQSLDERYNQSLAFRSALGSTSGANICFAVSLDVLSMDQWSTKLFEYGFVDAINLDGGSVSQMVTQDGVFGGGVENTKLLFLVTSRKQ